MDLSVYVCVVVEGMYTFNTGNFGNKPLCLCQYFCIGYVHKLDWELWQRYFVFMFVFLYRVCTYVRLGILLTRLCVYVNVVVEGMYTCKTGHF